MLECFAGLMLFNLQVVVVVQVKAEDLALVVKGYATSEPNNFHPGKTCVLTCSILKESVQLFVCICNYNDLFNNHAHEHSGNVNDTYLSNNCPLRTELDISIP